MRQYMEHLRRLGNILSIPIPVDEQRLTGRECPEPLCKGYFRLEFGTGLKGKDLPCHCPYCGHSSGHDRFWTEAQIQYAKSIANRKLVEAVNHDLKSLEFEQKPKGDFGIGFSLKITPGKLMPIHHYREKQLKTEVICSSCTLRYAVYGVFAFCPDCGQHNSLQILDKNLDVVSKMLNLSASLEPDVVERIIENALEDCVSAFDGFGREFCRVHRDRAIVEGRVERMTFQNLEGARDLPPLNHVRSGVRISG
jgi:RNase P subunit RPR2